MKQFILQPFFFQKSPSSKIFRFIKHCLLENVNHLFSPLQGNFRQSFYKNVQIIQIKTVSKVLSEIWNQIEVRIRIRFILHRILNIALVERLINMGNMDIFYLQTMDTVVVTTSCVGNLIPNRQRQFLQIHLQKKLVLAKYSLLTN